MAAAHDPPPLGHYGADVTAPAGPAPAGNDLPSFAGDTPQQGSAGQIAVGPLPETPPRPGHLYGGIISALLDEVMGRVVVPSGEFAVTGKLEVKFLKPVPLEQELSV